MKRDRFNFLKTPLIIFVWFSLWSIFENILCLFVGRDQKKQLIAHILLFISVCLILYLYDDMHMHNENENYEEESSPTQPPVKKKSGG